MLVLLLQVDQAEEIDSILIAALSYEAVVKFFLCFLDKLQLFFHAQ